MYTHGNRQIQGCEVNEHLCLDSTKPKSMSNKMKSIHNDFLDDLCVCLLYVSPEPCSPVKML